MGSAGAPGALPGSTAPAAVRAALAAAHRAEWGVVFGTLVRLTGDWELAEDCAQDAFARALPAWERDGVPRSPGAWLVTAARRRAVDVLRRRTTERDKIAEAAALEEAYEPAPPGDERLRLIFTCCHPALPLEARVALTLRAVGGLTTREIARAFLVGEDTVSQRVLRAKRKIAAAGIPYRVPPPGARAERLGGVLAVLYLIFTEGYAPSDGSTTRDGLAEEAIRLARLVTAETSDEPEARGLLALLLLQHSRRAARLDADGGLVTLERQDRSLWDRGLIAEGVALVGVGLSGSGDGGALARERRSGNGEAPSGSGAGGASAREGLPGSGDGPYALQAAIAAQHALAPDAAATDWAAITALYDRLLALRTNPVVALNRAVALGMRDGPQAQLDAVDALGTPKELAGHHALAAVRADALRRLGRTREAATAYEEARAAAPNAAIAEEYARRLAEPAPDEGNTAR
ncbi:RNA polymerase sigma-70 factor (ECF subfamily) [Streptomyces sp. KhCrAH-43]|uniref:RNA polymerase sigma factor n=1 Tax=unclassified Streptomyces TaxID=2593676 RepID=UPI00035C88F3|nr:sigma-70 family RNA polymerase sigma factor [Streptomyces sp. KhCrAH-43]RAJ64374.1 RNA polymerase sigma-70 factor (ECF subfamily) [Streptomyces sp. KhCrAH-43]